MDDTAVEELIQQELKRLSNQIQVPKGKYDDLRFDTEYVSNETVARDSEDVQEQEDYSKMELSEEQKQNFTRRGIEAYERACKSFDFYIFPLKTVVEKLVTSELDLTMHGLGDKGCIAVAQCIKSNPLITSLNLCDNSITIDGVEVLMNVMRMNKSITELDLSKNRLGNKGLGRSKSTLGAVLKNMLLRNVKLKKLVLKSNNVSDTDVEDICSSLTENYTLGHLDLSYNKLGERSGLFISQMLSSNSELKVINLEWNMLRTLGAIHVLGGLRSNNAVSRIRLGWNGISEGAAQKLGHMFQNNIALEEFDISNNHALGNGQAIRFLCSGLKENSSLKVLNLSNNLIREDATLLIEAVTRNESSSLQLIDLSGCFDGVQKDLSTTINKVMNLRKTLSIKY